jgi:hypothetical protein
MDKQQIIKSFQLKPFGSKGWLRGSLSCPDCGRNDKFAILFGDKGGVSHCFYCSTAYPLFRLLKNIGREDLLDKQYEHKENITLAPLNQLNVSDDNLTAELPIGYRRIKFDQYLSDRGFTEDQYDRFGVGLSDLDPRVHDKLIFTIYQKGKLAGWMARSRNSKEWHKENLRKCKELGHPLVLRYRNSENDFSKMLGGLDEITEETHTVILVEGLMDKANIDRMMGLYNHPSVKCCFTFGSDLSSSQANLIPSTVETVVLMYDDGTIHNMREAGMRLLSFFDVRVALIEDEDVDPGNITASYLSRILRDMKSFLYFYTHVLPSKF